MPQVTVDLQKTIRVWCRLDNEWGWYEQLKTVCKNPQTKNHIIYEQEKIDIMRHELMQACGFEDYSEFVSFIEKQEFATWDIELNRWWYNTEVL